MATYRSTSAYCRVHASEYERLRRRRHAAKINARTRESYDPGKARAANLARYGLTPASYDALLAQQGGGCAICGRGLPLAVDHSHASGVVRGLLCNNCNNGLGRFADDPARLRAAAGYLDAR